VLFKQDTLKRIAAGEVDLAFRRWKRPGVKPGTELRTAIGVLRVDAIAPVALADISERDSRRAGSACRTELLDLLRGREGRVYRIELSRAGADPRIALRKTSRLSAAEFDGLRQRLERMDRAAEAPWTRQVLGLIHTRPAVRAADLATTVSEELRRFKSRVRRLKELGLTESLEVGYRLSPRGRALLGRLEGGADRE